MSTPEPTRLRPEARRLIEEAQSRGAHDECMDTLLFTLQESSYQIVSETALREARQAAIAEVRAAFVEFWSDESIKNDYSFHPSLLFRILDSLSPDRQEAK